MDRISKDEAGRSLPAYIASLLALAALVPAFSFAAPASHWSNGALLASLAAIALVSYSGMVWMRPAVYLDGEIVAVLVAIAFLGPLPGLCVWLTAEIAYFVLDRHRLVAHLANLASYGWAVLAGALVLGAQSSAPRYLALAAAAVVMLCVNFFVTRGIVAVILDGHSLGATIRDELIRTAPATSLMIAVGILTAFAYAHIGVLALALFALVVLVPQTLVPLLLRPRPVRDLPVPQAAALYACAIARVMRLDRGQRLVLDDAVTFVRDDVEDPPPAVIRLAGAAHSLDVQEAVLYHREHWDGPGGFPGAVCGDMIPLASRVLAVALAWARLTAAGSPELSHAQALVQLESRAGLHFDPKVVAAVAKIVADERLGLAGDTAHQPRVHRLSIPKPVARLGALVGETA